MDNRLAYERLGEGRACCTRCEDVLPYECLHEHKGSDYCEFCLDKLVDEEVNEEEE